MSSKSNMSNIEPPLERTHRPDDIYERFSQIVHSKLTSNAFRSSRTFSEKGKDNFAEEKKLLHSHIPTIYWGAGCAIISFLSFRTSRFTGPFSWNSLKSRFYLQSAQSPTAIVTNPHIPKIEPPSKLDGSISVLSDILISMLIGCSTTLFLMDKDKLKQDLVRIPLVQGKSVIADELCPDFMAEYDKIPSSFWEQAQLNTGEYSTLLNIREFVINCQIRDSKNKSNNSTSETFP